MEVEQKAPEPPKLDRQPSDIEDEEIEAVPKRARIIEMAEWKYQLGLPDDAQVDKTAVKQRVLERVKEDNMYPYYKHLCSTFNWSVDEALAESMQKSNVEELAKIEEKIADAKKNHGDTEIRNALQAKVDFHTRIGHKEEALKAFTETETKIVGSGSRIDMMFAVIRLGFFHSDSEIIRTYIAKAKAAVEAGGDWERRNLLKIYEAAYLITKRELKEAASLLLDSLATFTCYELMDYNTFVFYTVVTAAMAHPRSVIRDKVIKAPEILTVMKDIPNIQTFLNSLYRCRYAEFFQSLSAISRQVKYDRLLSSHFNFWLRGMRFVAYSQFLQAYRSVTLASMANTFGVSVEFLDGELARFISAKRLHCKIDKVNGVVETNHPDAKNAQYDDVIKQGDALLQRIQKLTKLVSY